MVFICNAYLFYCNCDARARIMQGANAASEKEQLAVYCCLGLALTA